MNKIVAVLLESSSLDLNKIASLTDKKCFTRREYKELLELLGWSQGCIDEVVQNE